MATKTGRHLYIVRKLNSVASFRATEVQSAIEMVLVRMGSEAAARYFRQSRAVTGKDMGHADTQYAPHLFSVRSGLYIR